MKRLKLKNRHQKGVLLKSLEASFNLSHMLSANLSAQ